ncbi:transcriptional regulatory, C terminal family protein [Lysobacter antibioticus]|uniref:winged helix-turn-helix domain-containing protein n=1 Tax=Lysobacter antibioticus TaxID=84531 RepID=UPI00071747DD|nr:winged helix-turn-helix domain-containing protein [Lysobacter antibioticus]ALN62623.1 transcriptional regulatory, C terminal family protein [Lysobacter antibioticus]
MTTPWPADAWYLQLADLTIDLRFRRLIHSGQSVELPQRVFDLWLLLLSEPNRLHTRIELFDRLWAGTIVEDTNLSQNVWLLRKALGEERKGWIRTVAKSGYVFELPGPVQWFKQLPPALQPGDALIVPSDPDTFAEAEQRDALAERPEQASPAAPLPVAGPATGQLPDPVPSSTAVETMLLPAPAPAPVPGPFPAATGGGRSGKRVWAFALLGLVVVVAAIALFADRWNRFGAGKPELSVALVTIEDLQATSRWPAKLLEEWLSWKLGSLPEVNLLSESDLAADQGSGTVQVVFLSSVRVPNDPEKIALYVRFQEDGKEQRLEVKGDPSEMPALVDSVSRQLVARLLPARETPWPALELSAAAAQRYEQAALALDRRDWMSAVSIGSEIVESAPRFGLMRLQLAQAQARLAQGAAATAQMELAAELLASAPPEVAALLAARRLALDPRRGQDALKAFASLADRFPDKIAYQLEYARLLVNAGEPRAALARLVDAGGQNAVGVRIAKHLLRADAYQALGDPARMRMEAGAAERLARDAGPGWTLERADGLLLTARADSLQFPERPVPAAYEQAATLYEQGGNSTGALHARVLARMAGPLTGDADPALDALLARANAGGYHRLEVDVLVASADQYMKAGDADTYRARLLQASAVANASGDLLSMAQLDFRLLRNDLLTLRFDSAAVRIERLRAMKVQGNLGTASEQFAASLLLLRGHYAEGLEVINRAERLLPVVPAGQAESEAHAQLACTRVVPLVALGQVAEARRNQDRCSRGNAVVSRSRGLLSKTYIELLLGDRVQAATLLDQAEQSLPNKPPERWIQLLELARLATLLGQPEKSERIYAQLLPQLQPTGYTAYVVQTMTGQAESAAAMGEWARSRAHAAEVRRRIPADLWFLLKRLELVAIADALEHGDRRTAIAKASALHASVHRLGDAVLEMQLHSMFEPGELKDDCSAAEREALVARTGMRGSDVDWLNLSGHTGRGASR